MKKTVMNDLKKILGGIVGCAVLFAFLAGYMLVFADRVEIAPDVAIVFVHPTSLEYFAPPCIPLEEWSKFMKVTLADVRSQKLSPNQDCVNTGAFTQDGRTGLGNLIEKSGLIRPLKRRWNSDGTWNW